MCLEELGHLQPTTPLKTDNTTANGIANDTVKQKRSKAMIVSAKDNSMYIKEMVE
jgi:hypothetical protein